jgi:O-antigen/teichoic acid export membrane protein
MSDKLTGSRLLARNSLLNLIGQGSPLLVAVFTIPILIQNLGTDAFGLLTIIWMVIGYLSLFDFGLGRALTQLVAEKLGAGDEEAIPRLVWSALLTIMVLGIFGTLLLCPLTNWIAFSMFTIPASLQLETYYCFFPLALAIPVIILTTGLRGVLEAYQRFGVINAIRIPMGLFTYIGPLIVLYFTRSLSVIVAVLLVGRVIACVAHFVYVSRLFPEFSCRQPLMKLNELKYLFTFGSWMTVTNIISPIMVTFDRFFIGAILSVAAVAHYTTPYEMISKLGIIPGAIVGVLFPAFATSYAQQSARTSALFYQGLQGIFSLLFPIILFVVIFSNDILRLWLGDEFASHSELVFKFLAVGVLINSLAFIPFVLVQSIGRSDVTAKLYILELPLYVASLWTAITLFGINGAACVWLMRVTLDAVALFLLARRYHPELKRNVTNTLLVSAVCMTILLAISFFQFGLAAKLALFVLLASGFCLLMSRYFPAPVKPLLLTARIKLGY